MTAVGSSWAWLTEAPRETLGLRVLDRRPTWHVLLVIVSACLSHAFAETLITWNNVSERFAGHQWMAIQTISVALSVLLAGIVTLTIARLFRNTPVSTRSWLSGVAIAVIPFHLTLPAALMALSLGDKGIFLYVLIKLLVVASVVRRWLWATNVVFGWPLWAGLVLVLMPLLLSLILAMVAILVGIAAFLLALASAIP